ncbi:PIN domain-containing protein [Candidatus Acetothermia bacterium]|nr:PIN domain-containing protein [Candidatus Acetothermia bacterium]MBI3642998.1 PIN domain-containing protein [Candidatus Acetothermia bacterium]
MCIIIDEDVASLVFRDPPHTNFHAALNWLTHSKKNGKLVYGGTLKEKLFNITAARRFILELNRNGRLNIVAESEFRKELESVEGSKSCRSNDTCVIALARLSGARTLCTNDKDLMRDFTNPKLIRPKGKIYKNKSYRNKELNNLLRHTQSCKQ